MMDEGNEVSNRFENLKKWRSFDCNDIGIGTDT